MRTERIVGTIVAALALASLAAPAAYGVSAADRCEAAKMKTAGQYDFCRLKAESKAAKTRSAPDFSKCDPLFSAK
jgi:hypothetical protein